MTVMFGVCLQRFVDCCPVGNSHSLGRCLSHPNCRPSNHLTAHSMCDIPYQPALEDLRTSTGRKGRSPGGGGINTFYRSDAPPPPRFLGIENTLLVIIPRLRPPDRVMVGEHQQCKLQNNQYKTGGNVSGVENKEQHN